MFGSSLLFHVPHAQELSHVKEIIGFQLCKNILLHEGKIKCFFELNLMKRHQHQIKGCQARKGILFL